MSREDFDMSTVGTAELFDELVRRFDSVLLYASRDKNPESLSILAALKGAIVEPSESGDGSRIRFQSRPGNLNPSLTPNSDLLSIFARGIVTPEKKPRP
jgi:hypothetical protein